MIHQATNLFIGFVWKFLKSLDLALCKIRMEEVPNLGTLEILLLIHNLTKKPDFLLYLTYNKEFLLRECVIMLGRDFLSTDIGTYVTNP